MHCTPPAATTEPNRLHLETRAGCLGTESYAVRSGTAFSAMSRLAALPEVVGFDEDAVAAVQRVRGRG
jgi:hypothetical protein